MKKLLISFVLILFVSPYGQAQILGRLKSLADRATQLSDIHIGEEDEIALGKAISEKIRLRYGVQQDFDQTRYVTLVGLVLAARSERPDLPYQFIILDSNVVNAFAAPGGFIHITRGALAALGSEAELAGVLGHEIAHITQKHTIKAVQKFQGIELAQGQTSITANSAVFNQIVDRATDLILQGFGRAEELDSDNVGWQLASKAGYDSQGLVTFLETLKARNQGATSRRGLFASHPETQERIDRLKTEIARQELAVQALAVLSERYEKFITYEPQEPTPEEDLIEGARGLTGSEKKEGEKEEEQKEEPRKGRFSLGRLKNPTGIGERQETAAVTGAGAGRAVGDEEEAASGARNPNPVVVQVTPEDLRKFREEGNLTL